MTEQYLQFVKVIVPGILKPLLHLSGELLWRQEKQREEKQREEKRRLIWKIKIFFTQLKQVQLLPKTPVSHTEVISDLMWANNDHKITANILCSTIEVFKSPIFTSLSLSFSPLTMLSQTCCTWERTGSMPSVWAQSSKFQVIDKTNSTFRLDLINSWDTFGQICLVLCW